MSVDERPTLLAIQHVPWEGPHRILDACGALDVHTVKPLAGQALPAHEEVAGAVVMGGPMNVDEVERFPGLAAEREWLAEAARAGDAGARHLPRRAAAGPGARGRGEAGGGAGDRLRPGRGQRPRATRSSAASRPAPRSCTGTATSSTCPTAPSRWPPRRRPSTRPSAPATPGACSSTPRPTSPWSRPGWRCRR